MLLCFPNTISILLYCCVPAHSKSFEVKSLTATEGDDVTLICQGTRFLFDRLSWYDAQNRLVQDDSSLEISPYSVSLSLRLKNVSRNHTHGYECRAINLNTKNGVNTMTKLIIDGEILLSDHEHIYYLFIHIRACMLL